MRLRKGDKVVVISGKDRGVEGEIARALPGKFNNKADNKPTNKHGIRGSGEAFDKNNYRDRVIVEGVNVVKRHTKPTSSTTQGGIIEKLLPVDASNVAILCSKCGRTRISVRFDDVTGEKIRTCAKCGGDL